jgi:undecaprenyl-diphosphatase
MSQGLSRTTAAEFSFFLAVPTMLGATTKKTYDYFQAGFELSSSQINYLIIGNVLAFVVALIAIKTFIQYLSTHGFKLFGYYRIILGFSFLLVNYFIFPLTSI